MKPHNPQPRNDEYNKTYKLLSGKFPDIFSKDQIKPLKIGIHKDLRAQTEFSSSVISKFLYRYCHSKHYKKALIEGANRYDLNYNVAGVVTAEETKKQ